MESVFFKPWIGKNYSKKQSVFDKKILILGESHYCKSRKSCPKCNIEVCPKEKEFTKNVVNSFLDYQDGKGEKPKNNVTYVKLTNLICPEKSSIRDFWDSIVFYNFIQNANRKVGERPCGEDIEKSVEPFFEVIKEVKPDRIIVCGHMLWEWLPKDNWLSKQENLIRANGHKELVGAYKIGRREIKCLRMLHPSRTKYEYITIIKKFLK